MCDKDVSENLFTLKHCHDKYKIQKMYENAVDSCLVALKCVPGWFVPNKLIEELGSPTFCNDYIDFGDLVSDFLMFFSRDIGLKSITLDNTNWMMIVFIFVIQK